MSVQFLRYKHHLEVRDGPVDQTEQGLLFVEQQILLLIMIL